MVKTVVVKTTIHVIGFIEYNEIAQCCLELFKDIFKVCTIDFFIKCGRRKHCPTIVNNACSVIFLYRLDRYAALIQNGVGG